MSLLGLAPKNGANSLVATLFWGDFFKDLETKCFWIFSISRSERKPIVKNKIPMFGVQICA
jgi:hypothetical protein